MKSVLIAVFLVAASAVGLTAQTPAAQPPRVTGTIAAVDAAANKVTVKAATGESVELTIEPKSHIRHMVPGAPSPDAIMLSAP